MGADKRLTRGERSGRYSSGGRRDGPECHERQGRDVERDYGRRWGDNRHRECVDECRDSPERGQKRRNSDRSDDEYDVDYPDQHNKLEPEESKIIVLRGLPRHITEDDIRSALDQLPGPQPLEIRLMRKSRDGLVLMMWPGISRGFAFMEFCRLQDSTRWMETNQNKLVIQGKSINLHYRRQNFEQKRSLCTACGELLTSCRCGAANVDRESRQQGDYNGNTIILRNIAPLSTVDGILNMLAPYGNLSARDIRLIKNKQTGQNRGFAFVQLSSPLEASQLFTVLRGLQPPLNLDGRRISVNYAHVARKDPMQPDETTASSRSVASTAIAAAQWSSIQHSSGTTSYYITPPEGNAQQTQEQNYQAWQQQPEGLTPVIGDGLLGAAPEMKTLIPAATDVVISQTAQHYQPVIISQPAIQSHQVVRPVDAAQQTVSVCTASLVTPAASTVATTVCAAPAANTTAAPDTSTYKYDKSSGYYYSPQTGLYYDPSSHFYYNSKTHQYLYWDREKQTYISAPGESDTGTEQVSKEKKVKAKVKSAQQITKDMARWAKSLNKQKESFKSSFHDLGPSKEEDQKESAAADAGFSLFEKQQIGSFDIPSHMTEQFNFTAQDASAKSGLLAAYNRDSECEEGSSDRAVYEEGKITDWKKMVCLLCQRQFPTQEALLRHQQLSDLHKLNLEIQRRSNVRETELERKDVETELQREGRSTSEPPSPMILFQPTISYEQPTKDSLTSDNMGNKMLQAMGWQEGQGLGRHQQGIATPLSTSLRIKGTGLGIEVSSYELSSDTYTDAFCKAMFSRFPEIEGKSSY